MTRKRALILAVALLVAAIAGGAVAATASDRATPAPAETEEAGSDHAEDESHDADDAAEGPDQPITGPDLECASANALAYVGEGRVTETEIEDEESYYEVEVTRDDGRQIDVQLNEACVVVGTD